MVLTNEIQLCEVLDAQFKKKKKVLEGNFMYNLLNAADNDIIWTFAIFIVFCFFSYFLVVWQALEYVNATRKTLILYESHTAQNESEATSRK